MDQLSRIHQTHFIDTILRLLGLRRDVQLARMLDISPTLISRVRNGRLPISDPLLLAVHELTGMSFRELRDLAGDTSPRPANLVPVAKKRNGSQKQIRKSLANRTGDAD